MRERRLIGLVLLTLMISFCFISCSDKEESPKINVETSITTDGLTFSSDAGEQLISFSTNKDWEINIANTTSNITWCTASLTSGSEGDMTVIFETTENTDYDERSVVVTITAGTLTKTFTITQKQKDAILLTADKFEVDQKGGLIDVEVKSNINYQMEISESAKSWITQAQSRSLTTKNYKFDIAPSEEYDKREGEIFFKTDDKIETVRVYQTGSSIILLTKNDYSVSDKGETITVDINSNMEYGVKMPNVDWIIDEASSRGMSSHTLKYIVSPNENYDSRSTQIIYYDKNNASIADTLTINQIQKDAIIISKKNYKISSKGDVIELDINSNIETVVTTDSLWIKRFQPISLSRGLVSTKLFFQIEKNPLYSDRKAHIYISNKDNSLTDSVEINQEQKDTIIIDQRKYKTPATECSITLNIKANVGYQIIIPEEFKTWITYNNQTRGLTNNLIYFKIAKNKIFSKNNRKGYILIDSKIGKDTVRIEQTPPIHVANAGELINVISSDSIRSYKNLLITGYLNGSDIKIIRLMNNLDVLDLESANIVEGGDCYIGNVKTTNNWISYQMFQEMNFRKIILPKNIVNIGSESFRLCSKLESISIPEGVTKLFGYTFSGCSKLNEIFLPNSLEEIGKVTFISCSSLTNITIPYNVKVIGNHAFAYSNNIKEVHMKPSPTLLYKYENNLFEEEVYKNATLYIPKGSRKSYDITDFGRFKNIVEE